MVVGGAWSVVSVTVVGGWSVVLYYAEQKDASVFNS